jgi:glutamate N-acetyltransferase / amino-acid N-acetyltransferase
MSVREKSISVPGFVFSGLSMTGAGKRNLGVVYSLVKDTVGAAVFTQNDVVAAPVIVSRKNLELSPVKRAVLINSGDANAFTGKPGIDDAQRCVKEIAGVLKLDPAHCFVGSTGVIGSRLNMKLILKGIPKLPDTAAAANSNDFIEAIMTTDTRKKLASTVFTLSGKKVTIAAVAKGAGMIMPDMATMLSVILTDAAISQEMLKTALTETIEDTLNCISVDGDTSTNDSAFILANGKAGNEKITKKNSLYQAFKKQLHKILESIAKQIVNDGEGVTKFITLDIKNAATREKAKKVAVSIANSPLVKTAFFGENFNWGRILMAIGKARTGMDCQLITVSINGYVVAKKGAPVADPKTADVIAKTLKKRNIDVKIDFAQGKAGVTVWTCDFSLDYVKINANYIS